MNLITDTHPQPPFLENTLKTQFLRCNFRRDFSGYLEKFLKFCLETIFVQILKCININKNNLRLEVSSSIFELDDSLMYHRNNSSQHGWEVCLKT